MGNAGLGGSESVVDGKYLTSLAYDMFWHGAEKQYDGGWFHTKNHYFKCITYYNDKGQYHREDGPAHELSTSEVSYKWYIDDYRCSFEEWCNRLNKTDEEKMLLRLQYA